MHAGDDDDDDSISSASSQSMSAELTDPQSNSTGSALRSYILGGHKKNNSTSSLKGARSSRGSMDSNSARRDQPVTLFREDQRVSLRAFLRLLLQNEQVAKTTAMAEFLTNDPITLNEEESDDCERRKVMDKKRLEEGRQFFEIARKRAAELDVHMEKFRREIVEKSEFK